MKNSESPTIDAVMTAYWHLAPEEQRAVDALAQQLVDRFHGRDGCPKGIGLESAIRLLGCLGVLLMMESKKATVE